MGARIAALDERIGQVDQKLRVAIHSLTSSAPAARKHWTENTAEKPLRLILAQQDHGRLADADGG